MPLGRITEPTAPKPVSKRRQTLKEMVESMTDREVMEFKQEIEGRAPHMYYLDKDKYGRLAFMDGDIGQHHYVEQMTFRKDRDTKTVCVTVFISPDEKKHYEFDANDKDFSLTMLRWDGKGHYEVVQRIVQNGEEVR